MHSELTERKYIVKLTTSLFEIYLYLLVSLKDMEQNNENTGNESLEDIFTQPQSQSKQQNDRLKRFSETVESKMLMKTLGRLEKRKYIEQGHVLASKSHKSAIASTDSPKHRVRTSAENVLPTK